MYYWNMRKDKAATIAKVMALNPKDKTATEISELLGMEVSYARTFLIQNNIPYKKLKVGNCNHKKPHPKTDLIIKLHKQGLSKSIIRERTGINLTTIKNIIEKYEKASV